MISLIAAVGKNNELGLDNHLIFSIPGDLKFFRNTTLGKTVVREEKPMNQLVNHFLKELILLSLIL